MTDTNNKTTIHAHLNDTANTRDACFDASRDGDHLSVEANSEYLYPCQCGVDTEEVTFHFDRCDFGCLICEEELGERVPSPITQVYQPLDHQYEEFTSADKIDKCYESLKRLYVFGNWFMLTPIDELKLFQTALDFVNSQDSMCYSGEPYSVLFFQLQSLFKEFASLSAGISSIEYSLMHDIETNPGPECRVEFNYEVSVCECDTCLSQANDVHHILVLALQVSFEGGSTDNLFEAIHNLLPNAHKLHRYICMSLLRTYGFVPQVGDGFGIPINVKLPESTVEGINRVMNGFSSMVDEKIAHLGAVAHATEFHHIHEHNINVSSGVTGVSGGISWLTSGLLDHLDQPINIAILLSTIMITDHYYPSHALKIVGSLVAMYSLKKVASSPLMAEIVLGMTRLFRPQSLSEDVLELTMDMVAWATGFCFTTGMKTDSITKFKKAFEMSNTLASHFKKLKEWFLKLFSVLGDHFGFECFQNFSVHRNSLKSIQDRLKGLLETYDAHFANATNTTIKARDGLFTTSFCSSVRELDTKVKFMLIDLKNEGTGTESMRKILMEIKTRLQPLVEVAQNVGYDLSKRITPFVYALIGAPGTSKTFQLEINAALIDSVGRSKADLADYKLNRSARMYPIKQHKKHFDAYNDQSVLILADAFTEVDVPGQPSEASFIINNVGTNADDAPAAALDKKEKVFFKNRILALASNKSHINEVSFKSINNYDAVQRRVNSNCWRVVPKKAFAKPLEGKTWADVEKWGVNGVYHTALDIDKVRDMLKAKRVLKDEADDDEVIETSLTFDVVDYVRWDVALDAPYRTGEKHHTHGEHINAMQKKFYNHLLEEANNMKAQSLFFNKAMDVAMAGASFNSDGLFVPQCDNGSDSSSNFDSCEFVSAMSYVVKDYNAYGDHSEAEHMATYMMDIDFNKQQSIYDALRSKDSDFSTYLQQCCELKRSSPSNELPYFIGDPYHPYSLLVLNTPVDSLIALQGLTVSKRVVSFIAKGNSLVKSMMMDLYVYTTQVITIIEHRTENLSDWIYEHPILSAVLCVTSAGVVAGVAFSLIWKLVSSIASACFSGGEVDSPDYTVQAGLDMSTPDASHAERFIKSRATSYYTVILSRWVKAEGRRRAISPCSLKFIGDFTAKTVDHLYQLWKKYEAIGDSDFVLMLSSFTNSNNPSSSDVEEARASIDYQFHIKDLVWDFVPGTDRVFITFPKSMMSLQSTLIGDYASRKDVEFMKWFSDGNWKKGAAVFRVKHGYDIRNVNVRAFGMKLHYTYDSLVKEGSKLVNHGVSYNHDSAALLDFTTANGMCGMEVYLIDPDMKKFGKKFSNPVPIYEHTGLITDQGAGLIVTQEDFDLITFKIKHWSKHTVDCVIGSSHESERMYLAALKERLDKLPQDSVENLPCDVWEHCDIPSDPAVNMVSKVLPAHATPLAQVDEPMTTNSSQIKKSVMYDDLKKAFDEKGFKPTRMPIKNYPHYKDDKYVFPLKLALEKYGTNPQLLPIDQVETIINKTCRHIYDVSPHKPALDKEPLSFDEFMSGEEGVRKKPRDDTSCGFTFSRLKKMCFPNGLPREVSKGRRWIWRNADLQLDSPTVSALRTLVDYHVSRIKSGQKFMNINVDHLKDELRTFEKVAKGKSRAFCAQEIVYLIICGMYFYKFVKWVTDNRIHNGILIGINPYGPEWKQLFEHLSSKNSSGIFGDYGSYDKTLYVIWQRSVQVLYRYYIGVDSSHLLAMDTLMEDLIESYHVVPSEGKGELYRWKWGNTSGNFLTAIMNSVANYSLVTFACAVSESGGLIELSKIPVCRLDFVDKILRDMAFSSYGDDNAFTLTPSHKDITFQSIQNAFKEIGIEYTDELKGSSGEVPPLKSLMEGSMIGRGFRVDLSSYPPVVACPLRLYSILESVMWDKSGKEDATIRSNKVRMACVELSEHGEDVYNKYVPPMLRVAADHGCRLPEFVDWSSAFRYATSITQSPYEEHWL